MSTKTEDTQVVTETPDAPDSDSNLTLTIKRVRTHTLRTHVRGGDSVFSLASLQSGSLSNDTRSLSGATGSGSYSVSIPPGSISRSW